MRRALMILAFLLVVLVLRTYWFTTKEEIPFDPLAAERGRENSPGDRLMATMTEEMQAHGEFLRALREADSDAELREALRAHEGLRAHAGRLLNLAREFPALPMSVEDLTQVVARYPDTPVGRQAADLILRDHSRSERVGDACERLAESDLAADVLRAIARSNPHDAIRGQAEFALASLLKARAERNGWRDPATARTIVAEAEGVLEHMIATCGELSDGRDRLVDLARAQLDSLRTRSVGMVAPEIEDEDTDGRPMRLSDYRGRVVVLSFWGNW